jgi:hypothetical protein
VNTTNVEVTAGMGGFLVVFGLMIVVWLLGRDMTRRLRRMRLAEERRVETVLRERAAQRAAATRAQADRSADQPSEPAPPAGRADREADGPDPVG